VLATRFGLAAIDAVHDSEWGKMVALKGTRIELVPIAEAVAELRTVPLADYDAFSPLFG
jgi:6-phosphofructokinase 1